VTDGQTESIMAKTALCIASYADALSKMFLRCLGHGVTGSVVYAHIYTATSVPIELYPLPTQ